MIGNVRVYTRDVQQARNSDASGDHISLDIEERRACPPTIGLVEAVDANSYVLTTGSASLGALTPHLTLLGWLDDG